MSARSHLVQVVLDVQVVAFGPGAVEVDRDVIAVACRPAHHLELPDCSRTRSTWASISSSVTSMLGSVTTRPA